MAYLYRHIRLDKNEVFYIGIGSGNPNKYRRGKYHRAYRMDRLPHWRNIVAKTAYEVEIMLDDISWEDAKKKEIEFIALYKRICDGGTLVNLTIGGDGQLGLSRPAWNKGVKMRPESKEKMRQKIIEWTKSRTHHMLGKKHSPESIQKMKESLAKLNRVAWNKGRKCSEQEIERMGKNMYKNKKPIIKIDCGIVIEEYESINSAALNNNIRKGTLWRICERNDGTIFAGFEWKYKKHHISGALIH